MAQIKKAINNADILPNQEINKGQAFRQYAEEVFEWNEDKLVTKTYEIDQYIGEFQDKIFKDIQRVIERKTRMHITAPMGTGKNHVARKYMFKHPDRDILYLFPQIAIGAQFKEKLMEEEKQMKVKINVIEYNGKTKNDELNPIMWPTGPKIIMSTIDSAKDLMKVNPFDNPPLVFLDESHALLTSYRKDFSQSLAALKRLPIVAMSATPIDSVNNDILHIRRELIFNFKTPKYYTIEPLHAISNLQDFVTEYSISYAKEGKVIIFFNIEREKLHDIRRQINVSSKNKFRVEVFDGKSKTKLTWKNLMSKGKIDESIDIVLMNTVANAGVSIENPREEISKVIMVGSFDATGFEQFLGRVRNYDKEILYLYDGTGNEYSGKIPWHTLPELREIAENRYKLELKQLSLGYNGFNNEMKYSDENVYNNGLSILNGWYQHKYANLKGKALLKQFNTEDGWDSIDLKQAHHLTVTNLKDLKDNNSQSLTITEISKLVLDENALCSHMADLILWGSNKTETWNKVQLRVIKDTIINADDKETLLWLLHDLDFRKISPRKFKAVTAIAKCKKINLKLIKKLMKYSESEIGYYCRACEFYESKPSMKHRIILDKFKSYSKSGKIFLKTLDIKKDIAVTGKLSVDSKDVLDIYKHLIYQDSVTRRLYTRDVYVIKDVAEDLSEYVWKIKPVV